MKRTVAPSVVAARHISTTPTAVYRMYDSGDRLLYIGQSVNPATRPMQLADHRRWVTDIARITLAWFPTRQDALAEEARAIRAEMPLHNVAHNRGHDAGKEDHTAGDAA